LPVARAAVGRQRSFVFQLLSAFIELALQTLFEIAR